LGQASGFKFHVSGFENAFTLVEVTLALGVAAFCLLAVFGLLPVGISSNRASIEQTGAASLARAIVADLRTTPNTATTSPQYKIPFPSASAPFYFAEDGTVGTTAARYRATITIKTAAPTAFANIRITWPAAAPGDSAAGSYEVTTAIGRR
jgi:uncharacterized protein (TIGR02598 family)